MAFTGVQQVVCKIVNDKALRVGYCDFENDGSYDSEKEYIVENSYDFDEPLSIREYFYISSSDTFVKGDLIDELEDQLPKYKKADSEPDLPNKKNYGLWEDTDDAKSYILFKDSSGNQKKVELT